MSQFEIYALPVLGDNYVWFIKQFNTGNVVLVDPGEAEPILSHLQAHKLSLCAILITHHHWDHTGGLSAVLSHLSVPVYASTKSSVAGVSHIVGDGQIINIPELDLTMLSMAIPGHTLDHTAYYLDQAIFPGDTLFSAGCGRVFEGTMQQMYQSLCKLKALPAETKLYCAHEYTLKNLHFAKQVEPDNQEIDLYASIVGERLHSKNISLPSSIEQERLVNPFLRCDQPSVIANASQYAGHDLADEIEVFSTLRNWKDSF